MPCSVLWIWVFVLASLHTSPVSDTMPKGLKDDLKGALENAFLLSVKEGVKQKEMGKVISLDSFRTAPKSPILI